LFPIVPPQVLALCQSVRLIDFNPIWGILREAWDECGLGKSTDRFLASFRKPASLGDVLNKINRETLNAYQA
jgi:hypothetical protein